MDPERRSELQIFAGRLGHVFSDLGLLDRALTHTSHANEHQAGAPVHNEPFEFLGDAVLSFLVADLLHRTDPDGAEGRKTQLRAALVSDASLARRAQALGVPELLRLGRGEEKTGGRMKQALWAGAYEAIIAALYLDAGMESARAFIEKETAEARNEASTRDYKSVLQEWLQARGAPLPDYVLIAEEGPSHRRHFLIECRVQGQPPVQGQGPSKKQAQQKAAQAALEALSSS